MSTSLSTGDQNEINALFCGKAAKFSLLNQVVIFLSLGMTCHKADLYYAHCLEFSFFVVCVSNFASSWLFFFFFPFSQFLHTKLIHPTFCISFPLFSLILSLSGKLFGFLWRHTTLFSLFVPWWGNEHVSTHFRLISVPHYKIRLRFFFFYFFFGKCSSCLHLPNTDLFSYNLLLPYQRVQSSVSFINVM